MAWCHITPFHAYLTRIGMFVVYATLEEDTLVCVSEQDGASSSSQRRILCRTVPSLISLQRVLCSLMYLSSSQASCDYFTA